MKKILVSVIIPVYNSEKYLEQCIESLRRQTLKECEFIFIDDGSTDSSSIIINKYKQYDSRIILLNQENNGVSIARNNGIDIAKGKYISFVDSDDYIEFDMLKTLYKLMENNNCDLVMCNYRSKLDGHDEVSSFNIPIETVLGRDYIISNMIYYFYENTSLNAIWNKLYRADIIKKNNIKFPKGVSLGEDAIFNFQYFQLIQNFNYISYVGYNYRAVEGSATRDIINKDYFTYDLFNYKYEFPKITDMNLNKKRIEILRIKKFINSVISNIYIYLMPSNKLKFKRKIRYVNNMIVNNEVVNVLPVYIDNYFNEKSRYEKAIISMMKKKSIIGLYILVLYSWNRNRQ